MKKQVLTVLFGAMSLVTSALAQTGPMAEGEVRKIDLDAKKVTLKHGEIKTLDMPPMTMVFIVQDPVQLAKLKVGDKVRFAAEKGNAGYTVTKIEATQ